MTARVRWTHGGWRGWRRADVAVEPDVWMAALATGAGRRSRHARTLPLDTAAGRLFVKAYPSPDGRRARRAARMADALRAAGFGAPATVAVGRGGRAGLLVTRDVGGGDLGETVAALGRAGLRREKWALLRALGAEVGRLHAAGFVHGDLVPSNVRVVDGRFAFLDHDRTRRGRLLVWWGGRRNLVQLGRFVVPGLTATDRARVLASYAGARRQTRAARHRLGAWLVAKTLERRCAIDGIPPETAAAAGFRALMRSGGRFDPGRAPS